jgi:hypothetical protein
VSCSLTKTYVLISVAIAMLVAAVVLAYFFLNWVALLAAIALAATVSFAMIPAIRSSIRDYVTCRGPSQRCSISPAIDVLSQAAVVLSITSWTIAVALEIPAVAALASAFLAWLGVSLAVLAVPWRLPGIGCAAACAAVLVGVLTNVSGYAACRDDEAAGGGGPIN